MILVTGGTGLVGAHLLFQLVKSGIKPRAIKRSTSDINKTKQIFSYYTDDVDNLFKNIHWVDCDILDYYSLYEAMEDINYLYHCAASVSFQSSDKNELIQTNVLGTENIVNSALRREISKLIHVSSIGSLGRAETNNIVTEETHWNGKKSSVYSTSKYHAEMEVWRGIAEGLNANIVNPSIILGPSDWNSGSSKLFKTMYKGLKFYSTGTNGFVDVNDVAKSMILLMNCHVCGERFILNSENVSYKNLFEWMAKYLNVKPPTIKASKLMSEIAWRLLWIKSKVTGHTSTITKETAETANQQYYYSNEKIKKEIGISFIPIKKSIETNSIFFKQDHNIQDK